MKLIFATLATVAILSPSRSQAQPSARESSDSARLQGTWVMVSGAADGVAMPPAALAAMQRVLAGNRLRVTMNGQPYFEATIQLDPGQAPRAIDYHMTAGFTAGALQRGIYRFAGDTAVFCFGSPDAARPTEFTTLPGDRRTLSAWIRTRP